MPAPVTLLVHGGAGTLTRADLSPAQELEYRDALDQALRAGQALLLQGGSALDAAVAADGDVVDGWLGLAASYAGQKRNAEACEFYEKATTLDVNSALAWLLRGTNEALLGRHAEAKDSFERCLLADEKKIECRTALERLTSD